MSLEMLMKRCVFRGYFFGFCRIFTRACQAPMIENEQEVIMQTPTRAIGFGRLSSFGRQVLASAALAATPLTASIAAEDGPPTLNVGPSCEAVARYSIVAGRDKGSCMADERGSQDQISKNWPKYAPADKTLCVGMNRTGGAASYVELLSCLEVMRDAKEIHNELADPFLKKGAEFDSRKLMPMDVDEGLVGGSSTAHRGHKPKETTDW